MIYHLLWSLRETIHSYGFYAYQDISFRCLMAILTSMLVAIKISPRMIAWLKKNDISDQAEFHDTEINRLNADKAGIPTMGGMIILVSLLSGTLLWAKLNNPFIQKGVFIILWFGAIGGVDDWLKLTIKKGSGKRDGLKAWEKLVFQLGGAVVVALFLFNDFANIEDGKRFWFLFYKHSIPLANWVFIFISIIYITAISNAVNLTDGMDGLATGCLAIVSIVLIILCYIASETMTPTSNTTWASYLLLPHIPGAGELSIFYSAILGSSLGFLWFNCYKAQVFMGDTGSLPLGAAIGYGAIVTRHEILLFIIGGVFVIEIASVVLQVGSFRLRGKRVFRMAPIHHHFRKLGWPETKIVVRFWLLAIVFAIIALATLKIR